MAKTFTDARQGAHVGSLSSTKHSFGASSAIEDLAAEVREKLSNLLKRVQALESKAGTPEPIKPPSGSD